MSGIIEMNNSKEVNYDVNRYSRQSYSIGKDVMCKLSEASVLVLGYNILGQEIVKNLALLGINSIDICSVGILENYEKTGLYFTLESLEDMRKLNPTISINVVNMLDEDREIEIKKIKKYKLVILTNSTLDDAININRICHKFNIPFIMTGAYGLMGYLFNDFGDKFTVNDVDGEIYENLIIENINDISGTVSAGSFDQKIIKFKDEHKLGDSDTLIITFNNKTTEEWKVKCTKTSFICEIIFSKTISSDEAPEYFNSIKTIIKKKIPQEYNFKLLKNNITIIDAITADYSVPSNRNIHLHELHRAYNKYFEEYHENPRPWSRVDYDVFSKYLNPELKNDQKFIKLAKKFCYTLCGNLLPFVSIIGGIVSHEVLKVLGKKYIPITQWYYTDYLDLIDDAEIDLKISKTNYRNIRMNYKCDTKYEGIINIFGKTFYEKIVNTKPFIVGAGAIGCELLKNLGMIGVKNIKLTDMDNIEKSNLSRQFLFDDNDIRKSKAITAANKITKMNNDVNVEACEHKVCKETEDIFDSNFHDQVDVYMNALDNVDARLYMDQLAIKYGKPLIDSGTMGSKGSIQVVLPYLTESYGSTKDPDDNNGIPLCTIKSFPYKPAHTIQWARELFETEFNSIPILMNKLKNEEELKIVNASDLKLFLKQICKYKDFELNNTMFFNILFTIYYENFDKSINELIQKYSEDNVDGKLNKKMPVQLEVNKELINNYMTYGYNLLNQMFTSDIKYDTNSFDSLFSRFIYVDYKVDDVDNEKCIILISTILKTLNIIKLIEFEKDDDDLGHVHWITECANLRNIQYDITTTDIYETRKIAGNIIPAMITTTALVAGFQVMEYLKIIKYYLKENSKNKDDNTFGIEYKNFKDLDYYKNRYVNLNINYCDGITPDKPVIFKLENSNITLWDRIVVKTDIVSEIISEVEKNTKKKIEFMTQGNNTIYDGDDIVVNTICNRNENLLILIEDVSIGIPLYFS
jgi:ubiquitin-activating enzyme E1